MKDQLTDILIQEADRLLDSASKELHHAREDVNAHMVCFNSRQAIINYLSYYLSRNGVEVKKPVTMGSLIGQCITLDDRFDGINISQIFCRHEEESESYCLNVEKVNECMEVAQQIQGIVSSEVPPY